MSLWRIRKNDLPKKAIISIVDMKIIEHRCMEEQVNKKSNYVYFEQSRSI